MRRDSAHGLVHVEESSDTVDEGLLVTNIDPDRFRSFNADSL